MSHSEQSAEYVYPPPHPRRPLVLGLLGVLTGLWCPPLGLILGAVSIAQVRQNGGRFLWGVLAIVLSVATAIVLAVVLRFR